MARIVCQILLRPEQVTFIWSQEQAFFEPYHLVGPAVPQFYDGARQAREHLAGLAQGGQSQQALARAGYELYRLIFGADEAGVGRKVEDWLRGLESIESLEIVGDVPGRIPWGVVYDQEPIGAPELQAFWGVRYPLTTGRRVNPLRLNPIMSEPDVLLVLDPGGNADEQTAWRQLGSDHSWRTVTTRTELTAAIDHLCPDLLCWVGKARDGLLLLGAESVALAELRGQIDRARDGSLEPLVLLQPAGLEDSPGGVEEFLERAALTFPGLIGWQAPVAASAGAIGREFVEKSLSSGKPLSLVLRDLRRDKGWSALALTAFCPPQMWLADTEVPQTRVFCELPDEPYQALRSLDREDRPLLGGRDRDIFRFASLLDESAGKLLLLHGAFGAGKASFLRAGVIPFLEDDAHGYLALRNRSVDGQAPPRENDYPVLAIRATQDLAGQFAEALSVFCDQDFRHTTPLDATVVVPLELGIATQETGITNPRSAIRNPQLSDPQLNNPQLLWHALEKDPELLGTLLESLSRNLPQDLLILIEQGEELITLAGAPEDVPRRRRALDMLVRAASRAPRCRIVLSVRTDFLGRVLAEFPGHGSDHIREYLLPDLTRDQLLEVLLLPTANDVIPFADESPYQKYRISYADDFAGRLVDQVIDAAATSRQSAVALLQVVGARLHARARSHNLSVLSDADLKLSGGMYGVIKKKVENRLRSLNLSKATKRSLQELLKNSCTSQPDGTVTRDLYTEDVALDALKRPPREDGRRAITEAEDAGLLESQHLMIDGAEGTYVSLANDSLARVAQDWNEELIYDQPAWKRGMVDTLWITIPLICVAAALSYFFTRRYFGADVVAADMKTAQFKEQIDRAIAQVEGLTLPQYVGSLSQAADAWQTGNLLRMRQSLLTQQVKPQRGKSKDRAADDMRGFEWYYLWRLANSETLYLPGHEATVAAVAVSPDGSWIASGSLEGKLYVWDQASGNKRATLSGHAGAVNALAFTGDGKWLVSAGDDKLVRLWKTPAGKGEHVYVDKADQSLSGHTDAVLTLAVHETQIVSAGADKTIIIWDFDRSIPKQTLKDHSASVHALAFSPKGKSFASGDAIGKLLFWDADTGKMLHSEEASAGAIRALAFSPDGKWLLSGGQMSSLGPDGDVGAIRIWNGTNGGDGGRNGITHASEVFALAFSPDGKILASAGKDNFVRLWDAESLKEIDRSKETYLTKEIGLIKGHLGWVRSLAFAPDSKTLVSGAYDGDVKVWRPRPTLESDILQGPIIGTGLAAGAGATMSVVISADDKYVAAAGTDYKVYIWSLATNKLQHTITGLKGPIKSLAFSRGTKEKGTTLAAAIRIGADEGLVQAWSIKEEKDAVVAEEILSIPTTDRTVECVAFSPDGRKLAWGGSLKKEKAKEAPKSKEPGKDVAAEVRHTVEVWDLEADKKKNPVIKLSGELQTVRCLSFNTDGALLAAGGSDGNFRIWHLESGREVTGSPYEGHGGPVLSIAFYRNAVLSASADGSVRVWTTEDGKTPFRPFWVYRGHAGPVNAVVAADFAGTQLFVSAGADRTVRIWQPLVGDRFALKGHTGPVRSLALSADGLTIASTGDDGNVRLWRAALPKSE